MDITECTILRTEKITSAQLDVEHITTLEGSDLHDLCEATEATLQTDADSFSLGSIQNSSNLRQLLERYWQGALLVPERQVIVGRLEGVIASSIQLIKPSASQQASAFAISVEHHFVCPWARGYGLAKKLLHFAESEARAQGFTLLKLSVRADQKAAISLYEREGYIRWGMLNKYEKHGSDYIGGHYYYKDL